MAHRPEAMHTDARLARLLEVERSLEARVREAERAGEAKIAAAREAALQAAREGGAELEAAARAEEEADLARQAEERRRILAEGAACVARLSSVPESRIEELARLAVARVLARGSSETQRRP